MNTTYITDVTGTGTGKDFIPESDPVPNPEKADGSFGAGTGKRFVPSSDQVPSPEKADGGPGGITNATVVPGATCYIND